VVEVYHVKFKFNILNTCVTNTAKTTKAIEIYVRSIKINVYDFAGQAMKVNQINMLLIEH